MTAHLWEIDHPYYCTEGCYFLPGTRWQDAHNNWGSWQEFMENGWGSSDPDYNLLFRWDWNRPDPEDYTDEQIPGDTLELFFYGFSHYIDVTEDDEPAVRTWLKERAEHLRKVWEPFFEEAN